MKWISTQERDPTKEECKEHLGWFLVLLKDGYALNRFDKYDKIDGNGHSHGWKINYYIPYQTHWMPLPKPPEE